MTSRSLTSIGFWMVTCVVAAASTNCSGKPDYPPATTTATGGSGGTASSTGGTAGSGGTVAAPSCTDGAQNQSESDVDCGGTCPKCADNKKCVFDADCTSGDCDTTTKRCLATGCKDQIKNGTETDVDCGGSCPKCVDGKACGADGDCAGGFCNAAVCATASCTDTVKNGTETDIDCGGTCPACVEGKACAAASDCLSDICTSNVCVTASCTDAMKNGLESDVDCGGMCPNKCVSGQGCTVDGDCTTDFCNTALTPPVCKVASCGDFLKNGDETDLDCGGSCMTKCAPGQDCIVDGDCSSQVCSAFKCATPSCTDSTKNGFESDEDCGGANNTCPRCPLTKHCALAGDCVSLTCTGGLCVCPSGMVTSPKTGGGAFCIDQKEVSYKLYVAFYTANPPTANQLPQCQWNTNYTPTGDWPAQPGHDNEPVRYVNWCQAEAYCRYNNRHLCGDIGGGESPTGSFADANVSAWYSACSAQGISDYPYGDTFNTLNCVSSTANPADTGTYANCQGGTPALLDMSGNVAEWEDSCGSTTGATDTCLVRGGSFNSAPAAETLRCDSGGAPVVRARNYAARDVGFRCCL